MPIGVTTITPAASGPIALADAKRRLRVTWDDEDADITAMLAEAVAAAEGECGRVFISRTLAMYLDGFPRNRAPIRLPRPPAISVVSVEYYDEAGELQTLSGGSYYTALAGEPARIVPVGESFWPATQYGRPECVIVKWVAGYGDAEDVPELARAAVLEILAHRWERRGDESAAGIPPVARRLLDGLEFGEAY